MWEDISLSRRSSILGFYGCQDLNAHSAYICIKGFGYTSMKFTEEINKKVCNKNVDTIQSFYQLYIELILFM